MKYTIVFALCCFSCATVYASEGKKALIFGITGQDGSYLTELLLDKGYEVHGTVRRSSLATNTARLDHLLNDKKISNRLQLHYGDVTDSTNTVRLMAAIQPDEVYNLSAQSDVAISFEEAEYTGEVDGLGALRILEAIRLLGLKTKFYQASTSELFGKVQEVPQRETTPFYPRSPYSVAKLYAYWITVNYRESYDIFAVNGILFNHESPRRGEHFITRKVAKAVAAIAKGRQECLTVGNLNASRDWGYAADYVEAMWLMLQQPKPEDFVIATGRTYTVRECIELAFREVGIEIEWQGSDLDEVGIDRKSGELLVKVSPTLFRPAEVDYLIGDAAKANSVLGWQPRTTFQELIRMMVREEMKE